LQSCIDKRSQQRLYAWKEGAMAGASSRASARARYKKTEPLDLQEAPRREDGSVTKLRIVPVGKNSAPRSGGTLQIGGTVQRVHVNSTSEPRVIYARPVWTAPSAPAEASQVAAHDPAARIRDVSASHASVVSDPRENLVELQLRATQALSGLQAGLHSLQAQGIDLRKLSKSSLAWTVAVGVYALVLFVLALSTS
jgi:hypothetical protein